MALGANVEHILSQRFQVVVEFVNYPKVVIVFEIVNVGLQIGTQLEVGECHLVFVIFSQYL